MSSLETSVTLEDVFTVAFAKRVPLAPELAGYLALEIADGTDAGSGDVDPKTVFISEEGTVALVRPKRETITGDAEASVRALLTKLLDASGSGTPALTTAARRKPGNGLPALVEELEAALIPVNRAAGRRALARLVREVKRVLLGVGRNASIPAVPTRPDSRPPSLVPPHARPALRRRDGERTSDPRFAKVVAPRLTEEPRLGSQIPLAPGKSGTGPPAPPLPPKRETSTSTLVTELRPERNGPPLFGGDEVDSLLDSFAVSNAHEDKQIARELKAIAGLSPTPPPPNPKSLAELTKDVSKDLPKKIDASVDGDSVEALLALTDASSPPGASAPPVAKDVFTPTTAAKDPADGVDDAPSRRAAIVRPTPAPPPPGPLVGTARVDAPLSSTVRSDVRAKLAGTLATTGKRSRAMAGPQRPRAPKTGMAMLVFALLVLAGGTAAVWQFAPQVFTGKRKTSAGAATSVTTASAPAPRCKVALILTDVPANAEILLRVGQAPVDVERMPVGTRLELVATAEGYAPRRAVIKGEATWDTGPDGKPRIEVPIQLDPSKAKPGAIDPWPAAEPGSQVGGSGAPGTVHVVSNVRGAEVWLLAGLGPEARIDHLRCDADIDVLFAGPPTLRKRLHVSEKDIAKTDVDVAGNKVVSMSARTGEH